MGSVTVMRMQVERSFECGCLRMAGCYDGD